MSRTLTLFVALMIIIAALPLNNVFAQSAALTIEPLSGTVDTMVTVRGTGFTGSLAAVYYDKSIVADKVRISQTGEFTATFNVPQSTRGNHQIKAVDNTQPKSSSAEISFKVLPKIWVEPNVTRLGASVAVMGRGFSESESGIRVTLDGEKVSRSIQADFSGNWGITFSISNVEKGEHIINASGDLTGIGEVAAVTLIVGPIVKMTPEKGPVGTTVQLNGYGFRNSEDGVTITFDGELIFYNKVADPDGSWEAEVDIPFSTPGVHEVGAYGTYTRSAEVPKLKFLVIPVVKVTPDSGKVGEKVRFSGIGFGAEQTIKLTIDNVEIGEVTSDTSGSFDSTFQIPQTDVGLNKINAVDGLGNSAQADFNVSGTETGVLLSIPEVLSPKGGSQLTVFPSALAAVTGIAKNFTTLFPKIFSSSIVIDFDWSAVTVPDGINYTLQIAGAPEFASLLVDKQGLSSSDYTLSETEALPPGDYYWRVRAVDEAGNAGQWTEAQEIQVNLITMRDLIILVISTAVIIGLIVFLVLFWRARRAYYL